MSSKKRVGSKHQPLQVPLIPREKKLATLQFREAPEIAERISAVGSHLRLRTHDTATARLCARLGLVLLETLIAEGEL